MWDKMVENAINVKAKTSLQPPSRTKEIDSKYLRSYKLLVKKNKDKVIKKYRNEDKNKVKPHNSSPAN